MVRFMIAGLMLLVFCAEPVSAQGPRRFVYGSGERLVHEAELPPEGKAKVKDITGRNLALGFLYEYWYVATPVIDVWTCNGEYVLFDSDVCYAVTNEQLVELLGDSGVEQLGKPFRYRFPSVLLGLCGIVLLSIIQHYRSSQYRANKVVKFESHQESLKFYQNTLPHGEAWTQEYRKLGLAAAVNYLVERHGVDAPTAEKDMRALIGEIERPASVELRHQGSEFEQAGEWMSAAECYQQAADMMAEWDPVDAAVLERCVERVLKRLPKNP